MLTRLFFLVIFNPFGILLNVGFFRVSAFTGGVVPKALLANEATKALSVEGYMSELNSDPAVTDPAAALS